MVVSETDQGDTDRVVEVVVRELTEADVDDADRVMRTAFGTFLGAPEPLEVFGDADYVHTRFAAAPSAAFCAEVDGEVVGSNFATRWGSFGFFGPLTVLPELWDGGIASRLMEPVVERFEQWDVSQAGLFTFAQSQKHVGLYQKFGFWPGPLTAILAKAVKPPSNGGYETFTAAVEDRGRRGVLDRCRDLTGRVFEGLDVEQDIVATADHGLGETILIESDDELEALAVCHLGSGTEAGSGALYVKFGAVTPGDGAPERFQRLLDACEALAANRGAEQVIGGGDTARLGAYRAMVDRGYRAQIIGVKMFRPGPPGYSRADVFAIDDLR